MLALQTEFIATHRGDFAARFLPQQRASRHIPGAQAELPEALRPSASGVSQVKRRRAGAPNTVRTHGQLVVEMNIYILMTFTAGKAGGEQRIIQRGCFADMNRRSI